MQVESTSFAVMLRATFKDAPLTAVEYRGKPAWIASDVGRALGLTQHRDAARRLRERKKEGVYWHDLTPEELEAVRNPCGLDTRVTSATLILEPGLYWLAMTSETKNAEAFREWLAEDHLPALRAAPISEPKAALRAAVGTANDRWAVVLTTEDSRERHALWTAAIDLEKAEAAAYAAAMKADHVRWRAETQANRRLAVELNQQERRRLVGKLVAEMRDEIEDRRAGKRKVREVADLAGKTWAVIADDRYGQGTEPVLLRDTLN